MIETKDLVFVFPDDTVGLNHLNLSLPSQSRTIIVGANGAGKSTLLKILSGKKFARSGTVLVNGIDPFRDTMTDTPYLGLEWATNPMVKQDISVVVLLESMGGDEFPERRDKLIEVLDIDLTWHMHAVSDGQRRRVQLAMGLLRPWQTLLLDEVTVDLDVLSRYNFLQFLKEETEHRDCQVVYATHIFDGLHDWPTHIVRLHLGHALYMGPFDEFRAQNTDERGFFSLHQKILEWIIESTRELNKSVRKVKWADIKDKELDSGSVQSYIGGFKFMKRT